MGILSALQTIVREIIEEVRRQSETAFRLQDPVDRLEKDLMILYGKGAISREQYVKLKGKLRKGQLGRGDLGLLVKNLENHAGPENRYSLSYKKSAVHPALNRLYLNRARLDDARIETERLLESLALHQEQAGDRAERAREKAQSALPDEEEARLLLEMRQRILDRSEALRERIHSLHTGLHRIDALAGELDHYEKELEILIVEEQLAIMEISMSEGLFEP